MSTENTDWKERAEGYLRQYADPASDLLNAEAIVYFLSRGHQCEEAVEQFIQKWRQEFHNNEDKFKDIRYPPNQYMYRPSLYRLIDRAKVAEFEGNLDSFFVYRRFTVGLRAHLKMVDFYAPIFLFRSDCGIKVMERKLDIMLIDLEDYVAPAHLFSDSSAPLHVENETILACASLLFGCTRFPSNNIPKESLITATKFLIDSQEPDGKWSGTGESIKGRKVLVTAAAIHALAFSKQDGVERVLKRSYKWLLEQQDADGSWPNTEKWSPVYSTVFVLDALELAEGGTSTTFQCCREGEESTAISVDVEDGFHKIEGSRIEKLEINIGISDKTAAKRKKKKNKKKSQPDDQPKSTIEWKDHDRAVFFIDRQQKIYFAFKDQAPIRLGFERAHHPRILLPLFCKKSELSADDIQTVLETKDSASHRVSSINELIGRELEKKGFLGCPRGFQFIEQAKRGIYRSKILVRSKDQYDSALFNKEGAYIDNPIGERQQDRTHVDKPPRTHWEQDT